ncbi:DNA-directed RNA polymerase subunit E'' [archaeon]|jgi:RNA polymerase subunit RPABC4/transcription elongation factor Spt4|nr:DNA-directed RNA polymerase subunit E'' [archaeon]MBT3577325.1 DNA-directed RNA polymerase subunit E'' [archaeon]MBT6820431.1 DNA-directed RNA polymerase subunit E'' [archaeon]MBT6956256.1 DNA-directed RNA polymerase subunit E'' [archaeon]MBT7025245.1 DNA-directed RNA polymerase subunit E'' [archaeon]
MASKEKACMNCKTLYFGDKCPACGETPSTETFKGRIHIFDSKKSEMAENMEINKEGEFAIKTK